MNALFKKLNYKDQEELLVINPPESFEPELRNFAQTARIIRDPGIAGSVEFVMVFVVNQEQINAIASLVAPKLKGDAILWMCYPKTSSKKYSCDFNRDRGWEILGKFGMEGVRQVAIDENWSALRFRKVEYIKTLKRKFDTLSKEGKEKQSNQ